MNANDRPAELGYRWPAEWERHEATWLAWPHNRETWPGKFDAIRPVFIRFVEQLAQHERVEILAGSASVWEDAQRHVGHLENVRLWDIPTNDAWCRDHGPMFLCGPEHRPPALVDWKYNAWGGKYPPYDLDDRVPGEIASRLAFRRFAAPLVLEGGAIDGNGRGTLLTTESCLLNPNRNPNGSRESVDQCLADFTGASQVIWLPESHLEGDDTDGHVDQLARFVDPSTVVVAVAGDPHDHAHQQLHRNVEHLKSARDQAGKPLDVVPLPLPQAKYHQGRRLPTSYANFYIANDVVVVPQFDDPQDEHATATLQPLFPGREIVGLPAVDLAWGLGAFHCLAQQQCRAAP